jgi:uncharacterized membrane protein YfcA
MSWAWLALSAGVVCAAGIVRGYSGFGFSALCVAGLSLFLPPATAVPPVFVLEVLASSSLLRSACRHVDWRWLGWLAAGNALCIPLGIRLGQRGFAKVSGQRFRRQVLNLLMAIAALAVLRALLELRA